jgi:hypothetical protein
MAGPWPNLSPGSSTDGLIESTLDAGWLEGARGERQRIPGVPHRSAIPGKWHRECASAGMHGREGVDKAVALNHQIHVGRRRGAAQAWHGDKSISGTREKISNPRCGILYTATVTRSCPYARQVSPTWPLQGRV